MRNTKLGKLECKLVVHVFVYLLRAEHRIRTMYMIFKIHCVFFKIRVLSLMNLS